MFNVRRIKKLGHYARQFAREVRLEYDARLYADGLAVLQRRLREMDDLSPEQHTTLVQDVHEIMHRAREINRKRGLT